MIEKGAVHVYNESCSSEPINTMTVGDFFGEKALLSDDIRTATCIASTDVTCLTLSRVDFDRMLGNLKEILDTFDERHKLERRLLKKSEKTQEKEKIR